MRPRWSERSVSNMLRIPSSATLELCGRAVLNHHKPGIVFMLPWPFETPGGVTQVVKNLLRESQLDGRYSPVLFRNDWASSTLAETHAGGYPTALFRLRHPSQKGRALRSALGFMASLPAALWALRCFLRRHRVEAVNIHFPEPDAIHFVLLKTLGLFKGKLIISLHGSDIRGACRERGGRRFLWKRLLLGADSIVACSDALAKEAVAFEPRCAGRVKTIHNGISTEVFRAGPGERLGLRERLAGRTVILSIGKYEYRKGHDILLRAFKMVLSRRPASLLLIVGASGPQALETRALASELGLCQSVLFFENVRHVSIPEFLSAAELFVLASRWVPGVLGEGFPVAILEAAAACKPVISTASCGVNEIIEDGVTGRLVPLEDEAALAGAICGLLDHPEAAARLAAALHERVRTAFTWTGAFRQYRNLYR